MAMDHQTWLEEPYQQEDDGTGEFEFTTKLRGGTVKVKFTSSIETEQYYDGKYSFLVINLDSVTWTFHEDAEVDLTKGEEKLLKDLAEKEIENY